MKRGAWFLEDSYLYDFDEIAWEVAYKLFTTRDNGAYKAVSLITGFFSKAESEGRNPSAEDLFFYFRDVTDRNVNGVIRKIFRTEKSLLSYIHHALNRHIARGSGGRYEKKGTYVIDLKADESSMSLRQAEISDITPLCREISAGKDKPGQLMDIAFDAITEGGVFRPAVEFAVLRTAILEGLKPYFEAAGKGSQGHDPQSEYMLSELHEIAGKILEATDSSYNWRDDGSGIYRELYGRAARYRLEELIRSGKLPSSAKAFAAVQKEGGIDYSELKGSWQNFWKVLWERFSDFFRANS